MQIVGRDCAVSGRRILTELEGIGCLQCEVAYLRESVKDKVCPKCGRNMETVAREEHEATRHEHQRLLSKGRKNFRALATLILVWFVVEGTGVSFDYRRHGLLSLTFAVIMIHLLFGIWTGRTWPRVASLIILLSRLPGLWGVFSKALRTGNQSSLVIAGILLVLAIPIAILLCAPSLNYLLDCRREDHE